MVFEPEQSIRFGQNNKPLWRYRMNVLFIGGTGTISSACSVRAIEKGIDLTLLNRGQSVRTPAEGAQVTHVDVRDKQAVEKALEGRRFDVVVDWVAFTPDQVQADIELFGGKVGQYIFISSASAYQTPPANLPIRESKIGRAHV